MGELEFGVSTVNKFANLDADEDLSVVLARAQQEKKEKAKQAKLALKKGPEPVAPAVTQAPKPGKYLSRTLKYSDVYSFSAPAQATRRERFSTGSSSGSQRRQT